MHSLAASHLNPIESDLAEVDRRLAGIAAHPHRLLGAILDEVMLSAGKRIRPAVTLASGGLFRQPGASLHAMATAVELLHTATLIHDDVVDQASLRRGQAALFTTVGNAVAVLVGDYLFAQAAVTASETNNLRIIRLFAEAVQTICAGQIDESSREGDARYRLDRETYYRTVEAKTAALFMLGCETGGILGEGEPGAVSALRRYGRALGIAFQIKDDILDLVGDAAALGKPVGSDLRQGVVTLPLIYLRDEVPPAALEAAFTADGAREEAIQEIASFARSSAAIERSYEDARHLVDEAIQELASVPAGPYRDLLADLALSAVERPV
jgi:geranylgeranyl pyrophosphate synthase